MTNEKLYEIRHMKVDAQREFIANCLDLGPGWQIDAGRLHWVRLFDALLGILLEDGPRSFYREIGRIRVERAL